MNRHRIFAAFRRARRTAASSTSPESEWMPLADAAQALWTAQRGSDLDRMARGLSADTEALLTFWAHRVAQVGVPVHGCRIMSDTLEPIPTAVMAAGRIYDRATRLDIGHGEPSQDFCILQVRRRDFESRLKVLGTDAHS